MNHSWTPYFEQKLDLILEELKRYVYYETPTDNKQAVDRLGAFIKERFSSLGCKVETIEQENFGNQLRVEYGSGDEQIMILGHFDTVKEIGTLHNEPWSIKDGKAFGPGTYDMKAGIVFAYFALQTIIEHNLALNKKLVFFWNTDEEEGSHSSTPHIVAEAERSSLVLVLEPAAGKGELKTSRKGGGNFTLKVHGVAAHAGNDHAIGVNAIEEIAHHILSIQSWTNYDKGTTLSVGNVIGGTKSNVVPDYAEAIIDVRVTQKEEVNRINQLFQQLTPVNPRAKLVVEGSFDKLPMERTAEVEKLYTLASELAALEGYELTETMAGGTSDGNIAATAGVPVLDGLGPAGDGAHATHEHIIINEIPKRVALLLRLLTSL